jgi:hypothetical protein
MDWGRIDHPAPDDSFASENPYSLTMNDFADNERHGSKRRGGREEVSEKHYC